MAKRLIKVAIGLLLAVILLPVVVLGGLVAAVAIKHALLPGTTPILTEFVDRLQTRSREFVSGSSLSMPLPELAEDEMIVLAMNLYATAPSNDSRLSPRAHDMINDDSLGEGAGKTFLYYVKRGEILGRLSVSRCNLTINLMDPLIITATNKTATLACESIRIPSRPDECSRIPELWNQRCGTRLTLE